MVEDQERLKKIRSKMLVKLWRQSITVRRKTFTLAELGGDISPWGQFPWLGSMTFI